MDVSITTNLGNMLLIVTMGVSACGKSTLGAALSKALNLTFVDGDDFHTLDNIDKMKSRIPLTDEDRIPWLQSIRSAIDQYAKMHPDGAGMVIACSALSRRYRNILRGTSDSNEEAERLPVFVYMQGDPETITQRMQSREHHFWSADARMLQSQFEALEDPVGEPGVVTVSVQETTSEQVQLAIEEIEKLTRKSL